MVELTSANIELHNNQWLQSDLSLCSPIPPNTPHAVSVSLPKWKDNIDYEEGNPRVMDIMKSGYPRFCIHESVVKLNEQLAKRVGRVGSICYSFPSKRIVEECKKFVIYHCNQQQRLVLDSLILAEYQISSIDNDKLPTVTLHLIFFDQILQPLIKQFWQHTGEIITSRLAEHCLNCLKTPTSPNNTNIIAKKNQRYRKYTKENAVESEVSETFDPIFIEERYGRNLSIEFVHLAKLSLKKRIKLGNQLNNDLVNDTEKLNGIEDVFLYPTGMSAIYNAHRLVLNTIGEFKTVCFGFPYTDTLKILQKFGTGCYFLGHGDNSDIELLENILLKEKISALFCEFPGNPLLKSVDLLKLRQLADKFGFIIIVDDTLGSFININVSEVADIMVSSLTKIFSGDSNVMGGSLVVSSKSKHYNMLKRGLNQLYEDLLWYEDILFLERNSRTFETRVKKINQSTEILCDYLKSHSLVHRIHYPKYTTPSHYQQFKTSNGGYGSLFSIEFKNELNAITFYDNLLTAKGPSLGTNFTLVCPYTLLAHYNELDWAKQFGVNSNLVRVAIGLEDIDWLKEAFGRALKSIEHP
ncbi:PLP-dependent transferase [Neoconidiobolus thromboides FSU 785]|nr:PLP-dependent transferase [Neoconidiobolus thromboides FSU 785]